MVVLKSTLARDGTRCCRIHRRMIAGLGRPHPRLCLLHRIGRRCAVRAVEQPVVRAVGKREIIPRIAELIINLKARIRRQADHIVQRRDSNLVVVPRRRQILLCVRKLNLRGEHIRARHRPHAELRVDIGEMRRQRRHRILAHLDQIACLEDVEIIRRRRQANRLLCLFKRKVGSVQPIARRLALCVQRGIVDRHRNRACIAVVIVVLDPRRTRLSIRLAADTVRRRLPRELRTHRAVRLRKRRVRSVHIRQCLLDRAVVLERHLHALREIDLHRLRRHGTRKKSDRGGQCQCSYKVFGKTSPLVQIHFLLVRFKDAPERRAAPK